jgi:hypothetical protein
MLPHIIADIRNGLVAVKAQVDQKPDSDLLYVNGEFSLSVVIARCAQTYSGAYRWRIRFDNGLAPDFSIVVRMDAANQKPFDYFIFPRIDLPLSGIRLNEENSISLEGYRFDSLDPFYSLSERIALSQVA